MLFLSSVFHQLFGGSLGGGNASGLASLLGGAGGPRVRQVTNQVLSMIALLAFKLKHDVQLFMYSKWLCDFTLVCS